MRIEFKGTENTESAEGTTRSRRSNSSSPSPPTPHPPSTMVSDTLGYMPLSRVVRLDKQTKILLGLAFLAGIAVFWTIDAIQRRASLSPLTSALDNYRSSSSSPNIQTLALTSVTPDVTISVDVHPNLPRQPFLSRAILTSALGDTIPGPRISYISEHEMLKHKPRTIVQIRTKAPFR